MLAKTLALAISLALPSVAVQEAAPLTPLTIGAQEHAVQFLTLNPKGSVLYSAGEQGEVQAWDMKKDKLLWTTNVKGAGSPFTGIGVFGDHLAYSQTIPMVARLDLKTGKEFLMPMGSPNMMERPNSMRCDPKERWVWLGFATGKVARLDLENINNWGLRDLENGGVAQLAVSPKGSDLAASGMDMTIRYMNASNFSVEKRKVSEGHESEITALVFDAKGKYLLSGDQSGMLFFWKASSGNLLYSMDAHNAQITAIACDPKSKWFATGDANGTIKIWPLKNKQVEAKLTMPSETGRPVLALLPVDKGKSLASGGSRSKVSVWDLSIVKF